MPPSPTLVPDPSGGPGLLDPSAGPHLRDVLPAALAALTATPLSGTARSGAARSGSMPAAPPGLTLEPARAVVVLLVDGLGHDALQEHAEVAPYLAANRARVLTAGFPTTTATSLTSFGTGQPSGCHGMVGLEMLVPGEDRVLTALAWDPAVDPVRWQPRPTVLEDAARSGVAVTRVGPGAFDGSGLTQAALRGGRYVAAETLGERVAATLAAAAGTTPALVYCYYGELDATGHRQGRRSEAFLHQLAVVDLLVARLAEGLPPGSTLLVTADHGMVDVPPERRLDVAGVPELLDGVAHLVGEARARHVHVRPGARDDVLAAWREALTGRAHVLSREEAVRAGWYGPVDPAVLPRIGDVVAVALEDWCLVDSRRMHPGLLSMAGWHGSLTAAELLVPLLEVSAPAR